MAVEEHTGKQTIEHAGEQPVELAGEQPVEARSSTERRMQLGPNGPRSRAGRPWWWVPRQLATIALAHVCVLIGVYFLLLLGDALFTSYAIALQDAVFVSYVAQLGWLQRMASDVKGAIAFVVGISAVFQMLVLLWRSVF